MSGVLDGIRVLDWTIWQMGPVASSMLGDLGAEVVKLEPLGSGDPGRGLQKLRGVPCQLPQGRNVYFESNNRNKKGIAIDLSKPAGRQIIYRIIPKFDVFIQNFRHGVASRLEMGYSNLKKYNQRLICVNGSGYGPKGPDATAPAFDAVGQARSGIMFAAGEPDTPPVFNAGGIADQLGGIMMAYGVLAALIAREKYGIGQEIDVSHLGSMIHLQASSVNMLGAGKKNLGRMPRSGAPNPLWNYYRCRDGRWIFLSHLQPERYWVNFCNAIGHPELIGDPRWSSIAAAEKNAAELVAILDAAFASRDYAEWEKLLKEGGDFIFSRVNDIDDVMEDPQALCNDYVIDYDHPALGKIKTSGFPVHLSETPCSVRLPAPEYAQHTEEIMLELGAYTWEEIGQLKEEGVI